MIRYNLTFQGNNFSKTLFMGILLQESTKKESKTLAFFMLGFYYLISSNFCRLYYPGQ